LCKPDHVELKRALLFIFINAGSFSPDTEIVTWPSLHLT
jgi:hypothetical protein